MQIGISGGAGFIGTRLATALVSAGHQVDILDNLHPQVHPTPSRPKELPAAARLVIGDVTEPADWDRWIQTCGAPDVLVHLAAETGTGQSLAAASRHGRVNVVGTTEMIDACTRHEIRPDQILIASSRAVYGEGRWRTPNGDLFYADLRTDEQLQNAQWDPVGPDGSVGGPIAHRTLDVEPRPTNVYAATKLAQEHILTAWCGAHDVPLAVLRLQNVYGPGQAIGNPYTGVLTHFARQLAEGRQLDVYEDGQIIRDFVFVDDVVRAFRLAIERSQPESLRLDIGFGRPLALIEVARLMTEMTAAGPPIISGKYRNGDVRAAFADITDAEQRLHWSPLTNAETGLRSLVEWVAAEMIETAER